MTLSHSANRTCRKLDIEKITSYLMAGITYTVEPLSDDDKSESNASKAILALHEVYEDNYLEQLDLEAEIDCAVLGDASRPGFWITVGIALIMAVKGRLVIDFFMELGGANRTIRRLVRLYGMAIPLLLILSYLFATQIAQMTALG